MVSIKSVVNCIIINTLLSTIGVIQCICIEKQSNIYGWFIMIFMAFVIRNYGLMTLIDYGTRHKQLIQNHVVVKEAFKHEFHLNIISSTFVETFTYAFVRRYMFNRYATITFNDIILFIPLSFLFELIFDFFHYWSHRLVHHKFLYRYIHKKHHKFTHPTTRVTYYQDPLDLLITNSIPTILTLQIVPFFSVCQYNIMLIFKEYIEISGHCGKLLYPTSSFSQCIWIPRYFNIQLYTEDHDLHHSFNNCNFSKRFVIWDKVYGTYKSHYKVDSK